MEKERALDSPAFGKLLRRHRLAVGLSQEALAERARMSTIGVGALERGDRRTPQRETIALLAQALALSADGRREFEAAAARSASTRVRGGAASRPVFDANASVARSHNLPLSMRSLVGRETDVAEIVGLIEQTRLVTITGAGGVGKTSAALEVGRTLLDRTDAGIWLVEFAPVRDRSLVAATIARALDIQKRPNRPLLETLLAYLKKKTLVLILDNCEHVVEEAACVAAAMLRRCPGVRILATSREPLRIAGERSYRLPSLAFPTASSARALRAGEADAYGAVALFVQRARAVDHRFGLSDENAPIVAEVCRRLDGIPLAIELAAARVTILSIQALAEKLDRRFAILTGGDRTALPRHQTMRALIDWSYDLLPPNEQRLFESLSIFAGGSTLGAAAAVCGTGPSTAGGADTADVLALLSSLVDKSLVVADLGDRQPRYRLLESAREYGREKLVAHGKRDLVAKRHACACLELAEQLEATYRSNSDRVWRAHAQAELENWREALGWALGARGDVVVGQRLAGALMHVWNDFAVVEGRRVVVSALELVGEHTPPRVLAKLHITDSAIALSLCEHEAALAAAQRAMMFYRDLDDVMGTAWAQYLAGLPLLLLGRLEEGESLLRQALTTARKLGDRRLLAGVLRHIAYAHGQNGDFDGGRVAYAEARAIYAAFGADQCAAGTIADLAELEFRSGDAETALRHAADAITMLRERDAGVDVTTLINMSAYLVALDRYDAAEARAREALPVAREQQRDAVVAFALQHLGAVAALRPHAGAERALEARRRAARIVGFVDARLTVLAHVPRAYTEHQEYDRVVAALCAAIGEAELAKYRAAGAALTEDEAIEEALRV